MSEQYVPDPFVPQTLASDELGSEARAAEASGSEPSAPEVSAAPLSRSAIARIIERFRLFLEHYAEIRDLVRNIERRAAEGPPDTRPSLETRVRRAQAFERAARRKVDALALMIRSTPI